MLRRGSIVVASDPYGHTPRRPYLILSDEAHPSISLEGRFVEGDLSEQSFVSPWAVVSLREADIERAVAIVDQTVTRTVAEQMVRFVGYDPTDS